MTCQNNNLCSKTYYKFNMKKIDNFKKIEMKKNTNINLI